MENLPVIAIRLALYVVLMVLTGLTAFSLYALRRDERSAGLIPLKTPAILLAVAGLLLSCLGMLVLVAAMMGTSLWATDTAVLRDIIQQSAIGTAWIVRIGALITAVIAALCLRRFPLPAGIMLVCTGAIAIITLVWTGHAGATEGVTGDWHRLSDALHMLAATTWIGALAGFCLLLRPGAGPQQISVAARALDQFALIGTISVVIIVATGMASGVILLGLPTPSALLSTLYGQLLLAKLALFALMLTLAAANRWRLTPALHHAQASGGNTMPVGPALTHLRRSLTFETGAALAILALVAWLGTLDPLA